MAVNQCISVLVIFYLIGLSWQQRLNINPTVAVQAHNDARRKVAAGRVPGQPPGTIPDLVIVYLRDAL